MHTIQCKLLGDFFKKKKKVIIHISTEVLLKVIENVRFLG